MTTARKVRYPDVTQNQMVLAMVREKARAQGVDIANPETRSATTQMRLVRRA